MSSSDLSHSEILNLLVSMSRKLPATRLRELSNQIRDLDNNLPSSQKPAVLSRISHQSSRELVGQLFDAWDSHAERISPETLAFALEALAKDRDLDRPSESVEAVWTGPLHERSSFRQTKQVLLQLINGAEKRITVASFSIYKIALIQEALVKAAQRGVEIRIILESEKESEGKVTFDMAKSLGDEVASCSSIYIWPREKREKDSMGNSGALHIKCMVVDEESMFVSSANLTDYALSLNMELGLMVSDGNLPKQVEDQFNRLINEGILVPFEGR